MTKTTENSAQQTAQNPRVDEKPERENMQVESNCEKNSEIKPVHLTEAIMQAFAWLAKTQELARGALRQRADRELAKTLDALSGVCKGSMRQLSDFMPTANGQTAQ